MIAVDSKTIEILITIDSPTVCNAIELFKIRSQAEGFLHHSIQAIYPDLPPMVGHAVTCTYTSARPSKDGTSYNTQQQVEAFLAVPAPRVVVFQDLDGDPVGATFGEMMASTYMAFGCVGIVTSGGARDTIVLRKARLPLFARSKNVSHGYPQYPAMNVPIEVGGVKIKPGDLLHGDADGVTTVPNELAPRIAAACQRFLAIEKRLLDYLARPNPTAEGVGQVVAEMRQMVAAATEEFRIGK